MFRGPHNKDYSILGSLDDLPEYLGKKHGNASGQQNAFYTTSKLVGEARFDPIVRFDNLSPEW